MDPLTRYRDHLGSVPGWFAEVDARCFVVADRCQTAAGTRGDLLEIGVYHGKSAILLGDLCKPGETLVVCDIFEEEAGVSAENRAEHRAYHGDLRRSAFEAHYRRFHPELPTIIAAPSATLDRERLAGRFRLVHIDGSHTETDVRQDILTARQLLGPGGVVIFDDWAQAHCPGVALAIWEEYLRGDLTLLGLTLSKMYATWDPRGLTPETWDQAVQAAGLRAGVEGRRTTYAPIPYRLQGRPVQLYYLPAPPRPPVAVSGWRRWMSRA
jgi:hypothetical protein